MGVWRLPAFLACYQYLKIRVVAGYINGVQGFGV